MKQSKIYYEAAKIFDTCEVSGCCHAITNAIIGSPAFDSYLTIYIAKEDFKRYFDDIQVIAYWMDPNSEDDINEVHNRRVLALLFMAEIAKDDE